MKKQRIYDLVKKLLTEYPATRDNDKKLQWLTFGRLGFITGSYIVGRELKSYITFEDFFKAPSTETIRRCRQKVQELNPELRGSKFVQEKRAEKAEQKGMFVFHENYSDV
jgi:hypothetical protein